MPSYPSTGADIFELRTGRGKPNGYASLDALGHIPASQILDVDTGGGGGSGLSPSGTVAPGTTFGQQPVVGVALTFSPGDHSHGTPVLNIPGPVQSSTAPQIVNGSVILTNGLAVSRIAPIANVTGIILQVGNTPAQRLAVLNEGGFTATFAAADISFVSTGTGCVVTAGTFLDFIWNSVTALWYPTASIAGGSAPSHSIYGVAVYGVSTYG